jgi:hypothetical protein
MAQIYKISWVLLCSDIKKKDFEAQNLTNFANFAQSFITNTKKVLA